MQRRFLDKLLLANFIGLSLAAPVAQTQVENEQNIKQLMHEKRCVLCHDRTGRRVGPPYRMIADLHAGKEGIVDKLARKIIEGGMGTWGTTPMPPNSHVSEEEARALAEWIMELNRTE